MYDVIVVGAGIMGCATAYALAKEGKKTLLIEQFPLPHTRGSSHGATRVTRIAYNEEFNADIMIKAFPMWETLEKESGLELFKPVKMLSFTHEDFDRLSMYHYTTQKYSKEVVPMMDRKSLTKKFPLMSFTDPKTQGCIDENAGILYSDRCLKAFQNVFLKDGGTIVDNCKVGNLIPGATVTVQTDKGSFRAAGVVLTCGAWTSHLLSSLGTPLPLEPQAVQVCYWKTKPGVDHRTLPTFFSMRFDKHVYGLPTSEYDGLVKIALHHGTPCDPDQRDTVDAETEAKDLQNLKEFVANTFPYLHPEPAIKERCMYTVTPDGIAIVDTHPRYKNIAFAAGFSGAGFKQGPVIGSILADLVQGKQNPLLADEMRAKRFSTTSKLYFADSTTD